MDVFYYTYVTNKETETQRGLVTCLLGLCLGSLVLQCGVLTTVGDDYLSTFNKHKGSEWGRCKRSCIHHWKAFQIM